MEGLESACLRQVDTLLIELCERQPDERPLAVP